MHPGCKGVKCVAVCCIKGMFGQIKTLHSCLHFMETKRNKRNECGCAV